MYLSARGKNIGEYIGGGKHGWLAVSYRSVLRLLAGKKARLAFPQIVKVELVNVNLGERKIQCHPFYRRENPKHYLQCDQTSLLSFLPMSALHILPPPAST